MVRRIGFNNALRDTQYLRYGRKRYGISHLGAILQILITPSSKPEVIAQGGIPMRAHRVTPRFTLYN